MSENTRNVLLGFFLILSLGAFASLMFMIGEMPEWIGAGDWELTISGLSEIRGISEGTAVYLNGVEIGRVNRLKFKDIRRPGLGVQVIARIKERYSVPRGAIAKLYGAMLGIGSGQIHLIIESNLQMQSLPKDGTAQIRGEAASAIGEVVSKDFIKSFERTVDHIGNLAYHLQPVAENLAVLLEQRSVESVDRPISSEETFTANVSTLIERFDNLIRNLNTVLGDESVQEDVKGVVADLKSSSEDIRALIVQWQTDSKTIADNTNQAINRIESKVDITLDEFVNVVENLDDATKSIARIMQNVNAGKGTAGLLVRDDRLYESGVLTLQRAADALAKLNRILGKIEEDGYITVGQTTPVGTFTKDFPTNPGKP